MLYIMNNKLPRFKYFREGEESKMGLFIETTSYGETFETNSPKWKTSKVIVDGKNVASVSFNKAADTTEIKMKEDATYIAISGFGFETSTPDTIPVKGTVAEVKAKLGL